MQKNMQKLVFSLSVIVCLGLFNNVQAGYVDSDSSSGNSISASNLDLEVKFSESFSTDKLFPGNSNSSKIEVKNVGKENFDYKFYIEAEDTEICKNLTISVNRSAEKNLFSFSSDKFSLESAKIDNLDLSIKLPLDVDSSLENLECKFDIKFVAWQSNLSLDEPTSGWIDEEVLAENLIETGEFFKDVTVCLKDNSSNPLKNWNAYLLGEKLESVSLPVSNKNNFPTNINSNVVLPSGDYTLIASGTYKFRGSDLADASFSQRNLGDKVYYSTSDFPYWSWANDNDFKSPWKGYLGIMVNDVNNLGWGNVLTENHVYSQIFSNYSSDKFNFKIYDSNGGYSDNNGTLNVDIYKGAFRGTTGDNGCIVFENVPYGNYQLGQDLIYGWNNVNGLNNVEVDGVSDTFEVMNKLESSVVSLSITDIDSKNVSVTAGELNEKGVEISWKTNDLATSKVVYGTEKNNYTLEKSDLNYVGEHKIVLETINDKQVYYYKVISKNASDQEVFSEEKTFGIMGNEKSSVVLNEFMPNPSVSDNNEWIELYNTDKVNSVDLNGWVLKDSTSSSLVKIDKISGHVADTIIPEGGYLVVNLNGKFNLNNKSLESIYLLDSLKNVVDTFTYDPVVDFPDTKEVPEDKTYARFPDGGVWVDPQPTPGRVNEFEPKELEHYQEVVFNDCFKEKKLVKNEKQNLCNPVFVKYVGLIEKEDSDDLNEKLGKEILERIKKNVAKVKEDLAEEVLSNDDKTEKKADEEEEIKEEIEEMKSVENIESTENNLILNLPDAKVLDFTNLPKSLTISDDELEVKASEENSTENNSNVVVEEQNNQSLSVE